MIIRVRYAFALRGRQERDVVLRDLPDGCTVFEALQRLGVSGIEVHAAVDGASAGEADVLRDGSELLIIPSIQGGSARLASKTE